MNNFRSPTLSKTSATSMPATVARFASSPLAGATIAALLLAGCAVTPEPLTTEQIAERVNRDQQRIYEGQVALAGPLSFSEALARALKYNLDYRLKVYESALARGLLDVSEQDLLPKLVVDAGYSSRSNDSGGTSVGIEDRVISLRPSTSEERSHYISRATLSWNALDVGIGYYRAKQAADDVNIAEERRRKILQNIVQDVRNAYWRAYGAQQLLGEAESLSSRIQLALEKSREAERSGILPPAQGLAYQRALLDTESLVNVKRQELEFAKRELAALLSLPPGTQFTLADTPEDRLAAIPADLDRLETDALKNRPELREEDYKARIGANEARKQIAALFPSLNVYAGPRYDSNDYLYNGSWTETGVNLSFNLLRLAALPALNRTNDARQKTDEARRLALSVAVVTQVRVSVERYKLAVADYNIAAESARVDQRLAAVSRAGSSNRLESELEALRTEARALVSRFQVATAYAQGQAAYGRILNSVGIDLLPDTVASAEIPVLTKAIDDSLVAGERTVFSQSVALLPALRPVSVRLSGLPSGMNPPAIQRAVESVVTRNGLQVASTADGLVLSLEFERQEGRSTPRAQWKIQVADGGQAVLQRTYNSFLPRETTERAVSALAEAATLSVVGDVRRISRGQQTVAEKQP